VVQSVELLLDHRLEASVRRQWQTLADVGLPSLAGNLGPSNRPHVTLAVSRSPWPDAVEATVAAAAASGPLPVPLRLGGLVVFTHGRRYVLGRLVVPTPDLLALQTRVAAAGGGVPGGVPHTTPGRWTPHVTLARALGADQFPIALTALAEHGGTLDLDGEGIAVRRWDGEARRDWLITLSELK